MIQRRNSRKRENYIDAYERRRSGTIVLLISVIVICVAAIIGLIWALLLDLNDDGSIGINVTMGEVKVDILDPEDNHSIVGEVLDIVPLYEDQRVQFEPGAAFYTEAFKVDNIGSIPIVFRVYVSDDDDVDKSKFVEAFEFYVTPTPLDKSTWVSVTEYMGSLNIGSTSNPMHLVIKMKDNAGNDFQGKTYNHIGITVYAMQGNAREE